MSSYSYSEFKKFYISNIILFVILLFVVVYVIINWNYIYEGNYFVGECVKPILITGIISLIFHLTLTWDDKDIGTNYDSDSYADSQIALPKYKLGQNPEQLPEIIQEPRITVPQTQPTINPTPNPNPNIISNPTSNPFASKYQIVNKFDMGGKNLSHSHSDGTKSNLNPNSNTNIFVSHKNSAKYGIKFV